MWNLVSMVKPNSFIQFWSFKQTQMLAGWTKPNAFHVCITSYKLVIQDHQSFRRKSWKYLILDEAQNIKNFKSQRWQLLLNFQTQRFVYFLMCVSLSYYNLWTLNRVCYSKWLGSFSKTAAVCLHHSASLTSFHSFKIQFNIPGQLFFEKENKP